MHPHAKRFVVLVLAVVAVFVAGRYVMIYQRAEVAGQQNP